MPELHSWCLSSEAAAAKSLQLCPTLCDPRDGSPPGSPIPAILQARTLEWVAISFSNACKWKVKVKSLSRARLLVTPMDCRLLPGSSTHGIFQARVLEWGAIGFSELGGYTVGKVWKDFFDLWKGSQIRVTDCAAVSGLSALVARGLHQCLALNTKLKAKLQINYDNVGHILCRDPSTNSRYRDIPGGPVGKPSR